MIQLSSVKQTVPTLIIQTNKCKCKCKQISVSVRVSQPFGTRPHFLGEHLRNTIVFSRCPNNDLTCVDCSVFKNHSHQFMLDIMQLTDHTA